MSDRNLSDLCPELQLIAHAFLDDCEAARLNVKIITTYRDAADQNAAHAAGLSRAGAGASPHNCVDANGNPAARAFDYGIFTAGGAYITDGADPRYREAGELGKKLGLVYGGDWTLAKDGCRPDEDHLQLKIWRT